VIPALIVLAYLGVVVYIGVFAFRRAHGRKEVEDYFLANRSLGPFVFLMSLFGTNMTAFSILGSSGHAFANGIVTFGLMASPAALVMPLMLFLVGTRVWALGKRHGFITPVQLFRDRWETSHIGTVIFAVQAALLVPYVIIGVMGGGTTLSAVSGGRVPYWLGGALVALVVMSYVFFGGMRGTAWVNTFQTTLFLVFGAVAVLVIGWGMGGFRASVEALAASPQAFLLTRERFSTLDFFSYTFIPLSSIAFPHITIFCLTAERMAHFKRTVVFYPLCLLAIWLPCTFLGVMANRAVEVPEVQGKLEARATLATQAATVFENARLFESATFEGLTGLYRREAILDILDREWSRTVRYDRPLSIALADLDRFKWINDRSGHLVGDRTTRSPGPSDDRCYHRPHARPRPRHRRADRSATQRRRRRRGVRGGAFLHLDPPRRSSRRGVDHWP